MTSKSKCPVYSGETLGTSASAKSGTQNYAGKAKLIFFFFNLIAKVSYWKIAWLVSIWLVVLPCRSPAQTKKICGQEAKDNTHSYASTQWIVKHFVCSCEKWQWFGYLDATTPTLFSRFGFHVTFFFSHILKIVQTKSLRCVQEFILECKKLVWLGK